MRDAVGSTWIYAIVMIFTLLFAAFLALALTYAKAYRVKNEMTAIIEKYEGLTADDSLSGMGSLSIMNNYLKNNGYKDKGTCRDGEYGASDLDTPGLTPASTSSGNRYYYCVSYEKNDYYKCTHIFKIRVFYDFNLPLLGQIRKFAISGQTNEIYQAYFFSSGSTIDLSESCN